MAQKLNREAMAAQADVHAAMPVAAQMHEVDRTFELPAALYGATVACYLAFLGITAAAFSTPGLILPMTLFTFIILAGFGVPTVWAKMDPAKQAKAKSWARFQRDGINTLTGHNTAGEATVQVLILPALIVVWGLAVVTIAALVR
jgi:Flp pilus assembly protein TadB